MKKLNFLMAILAMVLSLQFSWAQPGFYEVNAGAFYFSPNVLEIESGSTVTWTNVGGLHDVNFDINTLTGESFGNPESFSFSAVYSAGPSSPVEIGSYTFTIPGTYNYDCSIGDHASQGMVGQIIVEYVEYPGCTNDALDENGDFLFCNYDMNANVDDGSCISNLC